MSLEKFLDQAEDGVDPRVQIELERLNTATDEINKLEVDLDEARNQFRQLLQESTSRIDSCAKKLGSCINKVKPYYDARIKAKEALHETQKAAVNFERANSAHAAAKEMVYLAEEGLKAEGRTFDHAWQEMLNHATMRVNESESERTSSEAEHKRTSQNYQLAEIRVRTLQKELKRAIAKSRPYYELKIHYTQLLEKQKVKVKNLEKQVTEVKLTYAQTLKNLEQISDEIHKTRQKDKHPNKPDLGKRSEGVGAESDSSNEVPPLYNTSKSRPECAKSIKSLHSTEGQPRAPDLGDDSETGKRHRNRDAHKILSPVAEAPSSEQTLTPVTTISSPLDTDIWSEYSDAGNVEASPNSENDSSLTGPPDTESEDEIFKFPQALSCIGRVKEDISFSNLKGAGDAKSQNIPLDAIGLSSSKSSFSSTRTRANIDSRSNSVFEGVGICSFPVETELNLSFTEGSKNGPTDTENGSGWTEIKLSSPEEEPFSMVRVVNTGKNRNQLEDDFDIPYAPLSERDLNVNHSDESPGEKKAELIVEECSEKNGLDGMLCGLAGRSPRKENLDEELCPRSLKGTPKKLNLRRQSLDVLWNNTAGEKVKEILSQSIMKLNIGSLTERKAMDSRMGEGSEECENENTVNSIKNNDTNYESNLTSQFGIHFFNRKNSKAEEELIQTVGGVEEKKSGNHQESISTHIGGFMSRKERFFTKKVPSPLEKTLNYLNADEESNSDSESLASSDMLTDEQLSSLVLDRDLAEIYQDIV